MTAPDQPLPSQGGSYTRAPDGSLKPAAEEKPAKGGVKAPVKES